MFSFEQVIRRSVVRMQTFGKLNTPERANPPEHDYEALARRKSTMDYEL